MFEVGLFWRFGNFEVWFWGRKQWLGMFTVWVFPPMFGPSLAKLFWIKFDVRGSGFRWDSCLLSEYFVPSFFQVLILWIVRQQLARLLTQELDFFPNYPLEVIRFDIIQTLILCTKKNIYLTLYFFFCTKCEKVDVLYVCTLYIVLYLGLKTTAV